MRTAPSDRRLERARAVGIETCGRIVSFWGFTRTMGRIFGLLYLSPRPLARAEIQKRLDISVGSASMTLAALGRWGVVHKIGVRGQRSEHYRAETDFWKMISGVLNERERREIAAAVEAVEGAKRDARAVEAGASDAAQADARAEASFVAERLQRLHDICGLGQTMLDMLLGQLKLDVWRFRDVLGPLAGEATVAAERDTNAPTGAATEISASESAPTHARAKGRPAAKEARRRKTV